jgi:hypothetical protein
MAGFAVWDKERASMRSIYEKKRGRGKHGLLEVLLNSAIPPFIA